MTNSSRAGGPCHVTNAPFARTASRTMSVTLSQLQKRFVGPDGSVVPVVDIEHFSLGDAEQVALVGTSGSGKTTLLHLIAGILTPDAGQILHTDSKGYGFDLARF